MHILSSRSCATRFRRSLTLFLLQSSSQDMGSSICPDLHILPTRLVQTRPPIGRLAPPLFFSLNVFRPNSALLLAHSWPYVLLIVRPKLSHVSTHCWPCQQPPPPASSDHLLRQPPMPMFGDFPSPCKAIGVVSHIKLTNQLIWRDASSGIFTIRNAYHLEKER